MQKVHGGTAVQGQTEPISMRQLAAAALDVGLQGSQLTVLQDDAQRGRHNTYTVHEDDVLMTQCLEAADLTAEPVDRLARQLSSHE